MWKVHLILLTVNLIYGANYTIAKEVMPDFIRPFGFVMLRAIGAAILFSLIHYIWVKEKVKRKDIPRLMLCAFFGVALNQLLFLKGLSLTSPINASLMMITAPICVLLIAAVIGVERFTAVKFSGVLLAAAGAFTIIYFGKQHPGGVSNSMGDLFVLINAMSYATYLVLVKPLMKKYHPFTVMKWIFAAGLLFVVPAGWLDVQMVEWNGFTPLIWFCVAYVIVFTTFFAYLLNVTALRKVDPSLVGVYIYLQPIIASFIALSFGKDEINWVKIVAALLIFSGVYLVSRKPEYQTANIKR